MRNLLVVSVLLLSCTTTQPSPNPTHVIDTFLTALDNADANIASLFTEDATVFFPMNDRPLRASGRAEIGPAFAALFALPGYQKGRGMPKPEALHVERLTDDVALITFQTTNPNVISRRTFVLRRDRGQWRIAHLHGSNIRTATN